MSGSAGRWIAATFQATAAAWDRFWFTPCSTSLLGLLRILVGAMVFYTHAVWTLELSTFFSDQGVLPRAYGELLYNRSWALWTHFDWMPSWSGAVAVHYAGLAVIACFTLGLATRITAVLTFLLVVSYAHRATGALFGLDQINAFLTLYLAIGPAGHSWSLDRCLGWVRSGGAATSGANLALRLIQVQMCVVYLFAGLSKLQGPAWWQGDALWSAFASFDYQTLDLLWLGQIPWIIEALTLVTLVWEISYAFLVWNPRCRPLYLGLAVLVHAGIGIAMGMVTFGLIMIIGNLAFLPPGLGENWRVAALAGSAGRPSSPRR